MAKQLNVNMSFTADTSKAKQSINELQQAVQKLAYSSPSIEPKVNTADFERASAAARELAFHLNNAFNTKTGNLDLNRLNTSLKQSGTTLTQLTSSFKDAGATGQQAFVSLANAVSKADMPALSLNSRLETMFVTLKNVARFQISSSIMHGLIGAVQHAYGYAQNLNESLNNIRIVTGQSAEQMAHFAEQANKTARSLSSTTLDYTNASLIYYQQGLSDSEVRERTDVTLKMANVARESAETVSDQMTAIWNNFDDGSHSLEYYADVITALGAATASSSSEISTGLEKFAAVADTVGLSYENATAALATITATTRQSADTVGTGLRTLFSRLQGLSLGETLEDGVDLNKYSAALAKVGVQALDSSGQLRRMDDVLRDLGARWQTLTKAQQTALAQTVGGVRQYTTLIALMDHWDFMEQNQQVAANAEGTLQKQADIYAESWEAARKRVQAATESIYDTLIDDKFFIKVDNVIEHLLNGVNKFLDAFGGIPGLLTSVGGLILGLTANKIGPAVQSMVQNIQVLTGGAGKVYDRMQAEMTSAVDSQLSSGTNYSDSQKQELINAQQLLSVRRQMALASKNLSDTEKLRADLAISGLEMEQQEVLKLIQRREELQSKQDENIENLNSYTALTSSDLKSINTIKQRQINETPLSFDNQGKFDTSAISAIQNQAEQAASMLEQARQTLIEKMMSLKDGEAFTINLSDLFKIDNTSITNSLNNITTSLESAIQNSPLKADLENVKVEMADSFMDVFSGLTTDDQFMSLIDSLYDGSGNLDAFKAKIQEFGLEGKESVQEFLLSFQDLSSIDISSIQNQIELLSQGFGDIGQQAPQVEIALAVIAKAKTPAQLIQGLRNLDTALKESTIEAEKIEAALKNLGIPESDIKAWREGKKELTELATTIDNAQQKLKNTKIDFTHMVTGTEVFAKLGAGAMSAYTIINSLKTLISTWQDPDITFGEKLTSSLMSIGMLIPAVTNAMGALSTITQFVEQAMFRSAVSIAANTTALTAEQTIAASTALAEQLVARGIDQKTAATAASIMVNQVYTTVAGRQAAIEALVAAGIEKNTAAQLVNTAAGSARNILMATGSFLAGNLSKAELLQTAALAKQTGGIWANTAAWVANQIAQNGWAGLVLGGLLVAAITATTVAIMANTAEVERNAAALADANSKQATSAKEQAQSNKNLVSSFESLYAQYQELKAAGKDVTAIQEQLANAALEVGTAYDVQGAALANLTGEYENFAKNVKKAREEELRANLSKGGGAIAGLNAAEYGVQQAIKKNMTTTDIGGGTLSLSKRFGDGFLGGTDDQKIADIVQAGQYNSLLKSYDNSIELYTVGVNGAVEAYHEVLDVLQQADLQLSEEEKQNSEVYNKMKTWAADMQESIEAYEAAQETIAEYRIELADISGIIDSTGKERSSDNITNIQQLREYRGLLIQIRAQKKGLLDENGQVIEERADEYQKLVDGVNAYLNSLSKLSTITQQEKAVNDFNSIAFVDQRGIYGSELGTWANRQRSTFSLEEWVEKYNKDHEGNEIDLETALKISPYLDQSLWEQELKTIEKSEATIKVTGILTSIQSGQSLNTNKKTTSADWANWATNSDFFNPDGTLKADSALAKAMGILSNGMTLGQFLLLSTDERTRYLNSAEASQKTEMASTRSEYIQELNTGKEKLNTWVTNNEGTAETARNRRTELAQHLEELQEKVIKGEEVDQNDLTSTETQLNAVTQWLDNFEASQSRLKAIADQITSLNLEANAEEVWGWVDDFNKRVEDLGLELEDVNRYAQDLIDHGIFDQEDVQQALEFALAIQRQNRGLKTLSDNYKDWKKHFQEGAEQTDEWSKAQSEAKEALADILDIPIENVSNDLANAAEEAGVLEKAAEGDQEAIAELGRLAIKDTLADSFAGTAEELDTLLTNLQTDADGNILKITTSLDTSGALSSLAELSQKSAMTAEDISNYLSQAGWEPKISYEELPITSSTTNTDGTSTITYEDSNGVVYTRTIESSAVPSDVNGTLSLPVIDSGNTKFKGPGGSASSGGGGGGGGEKKPPKPERYHTINNKVQNNQRRSQAASRDKERATGKARLDLIKEENKLREESLDLQKQYEDEIRDWLDKDKQALIDAYAGLGLQVQFDAEGEIANFEELEQAYVDFGDESDETWKEAKEAISQYEETLDLLNDKLEEIVEIQQAIADAALEMTQAKIELQLDVSVDRFEYLDYLLDKIDDDAYQAAEAIAILGDKTAETMKKVNTYTEGLEAILAQHGFSLADLDNLSAEDLANAGFTQSEIDQIKDWRSELLQANQDLLEMRKTIVDKLISAFDDLNEKVQKSYDNFDNYNSVLEHYKNITDLMGRNISAQSRDIMNKLNDSMLRNARNTATAAKKIYDDAVAANAEAQAAYQAAVASGDYDAIRRWQEVIDATGEHLQEAEEQWLSSWESALELAKTRFEETMEDLAEAYSATIGGTFGSLDYLQEAYDRQKEINEQYLEDWDKLYELSKLSRDISKAIDDTDSIKAKEKLRALQAEINKLQADGTKLSEYDVQVLEKRFELEQARLALDDAQHAKSQVRLQRDANGNWGYVYTADEDEVAKAEQEYEDKLHEYQELNAQYLEQLQDEALDVQQTWQETVGQIRSDLGLGLITEEEAEARLEEINKWLEEQQAYFTEQSQHALDNQASLYTRTLETYNVANAEIVDTWEETNLAMLTKINSLDAYMQNWNTAVQEYLANTEEALSAYQDNIDKINDSAGVTTTQFENHIDNVVVDLNNLSDDTVQNVSDLSDAMKNEFANALMEAVLWEQKYVDGMDEMITRNEQFVKSINLMIEALAGVDTDTVSMLNPLSLMENTINQSTMDLYKGTLDQYLSMNKDQILSMIDLNANAMAGGLGAMSLTTLPALSENLEQNVTITASFPNATNHNEIEEAFTNLINKASQYANRKGL